MGKCPKPGCNQQSVIINQSSIPKPLREERAKMEMSDALMIGRTQQRSGGNDVLGIGIAYGLQCTELPLEGRIKIIAVANES